MITIKRVRRIWKHDWEILPKTLLIKMMKNQVMVYADRTAPSETITEWCQENLEGLFRVDGYNYYFEFESDMVAFKLYWEGRDESELD